jgi:tetratricopeptide (TPR) repeat protein
MMEDLIGQELGNYRLIRWIGEGNFADVYLAEHLYLKTYAAIKVLRTRLSHQDYEAFQEEAQTIAHLDHPNIIRVLDFGIKQNIPFLVMQYASSGTLRDKFPSGTVQTPTSIVSYLKQIASALQYAHSEKLVHRDIKPENMLMGHRDEVIVSDFGLAVVARSIHSTNELDVAGTIMYMAPEQILGKPCPESDQYALGVVVYEWLSGLKPFNGSFFEIATQHIHAQPVSIRFRISSISEDIDRIVLRALEKDPQKRFASIQEFVNSFEKATLSQQYMMQTIQERQLNRTKKQWIKVGEEYVHAGEYQQALVVYDLVVKMDPGEIKAYTLKTVALLMMKRNAEAIEVAEDILRKFSNNPNAYFHTGFMFNLLGYTQRSKELYQRGTLCKAQDGESWHTIGNIHMNLAQYEQALNAFELATQLETNNVKFYEGKVRALLNLQRYEETLTTLDNIIQIEPGHRAAYQEKSLIYIQLRQFEKALLYCEQALYFDREEPKLYFIKGEILSSLGREKEALEFYEQFLVLEPMQSAGYIRKGDILCLLERSAEALVAYEYAINIDDKSADAYVGKGNALNDLKRFSDAVLAFDYAIELNSQGVRARFGKGFALIELNRYKEAKEELEVVLEIEPADAKNRALYAIYC